jgi:hypothetical protein
MEYYKSVKINKPYNTQQWTSQTQSRAREVRQKSIQVWFHENYQVQNQEKAISDEVVFKEKQEKWLAGAQWKLQNFQ